MSAAQLIRAPSASSEAVDRAHQVLQRQVGQMSRLLEDLSDMSRLSRDKISIEPRLLSLAQAAREALEVLQAEADDAGVNVSLREEAPGVHVLADEVRLQQVAVNLLSNAIRYSEPGGAVVIRVDARGERAILEVSDEGVGIEPEKLDQIFHPFVQGEPVGTTVGGGMGVGLALVRSIVDIHHGEVRAESAGRGHGATFTVELPAAEPAHEADASGRAGARSVDGAVLLIEDSSDNRLLLTSLLEGRGLEVEAVATAEEGLERMRRTRFGGAIVDLGLPGMSGLELCAAVRSDERLAGLPLIAVTGFGREADRERARATGFDDVLVKPVDAGDPEKALAVAASGRRAK